MKTVRIRKESAAYRQTNTPKCYQQERHMEILQQEIRNGELQGRCDHQESREGKNRYYYSSLHRRYEQEGKDKNQIKRITP